jgi:cold shock protein
MLRVWSRVPAIFIALDAHSFCRKQMPTGKVKWFSAAIGHGIISPEDGGKEVFVHISAVKKAGLTSISEGERLSYELVNRLGKQAAQNLRIA